MRCIASRFQKKGQKRNEIERNAQEKEIITFIFGYLFIGLSLSKSINLFIYIHLHI